MDKKKQFSEVNTFLVKQLVIDSCAMTDEVFEQILEGVCAQKFVEKIHYVNHNILGYKSANSLIKIFKTNKLIEFCLSDIK